MGQASFTSTPTDFLSMVLLTLPNNKTSLMQLTDQIIQQDHSFKVLLKKYEQLSFKVKDQKKIILHTVYDFDNEFTFHLSVFHKL